MNHDSVEVSLIRGGTSKGVFLRLSALPTAPSSRDSLALGLLGSPDPMQLDGLGGSYSSTSKLMAVGTRSEAEALGYSPEGEFDVAYLFAQIAVNEPVVDWQGNCGNLTAGIAIHAMYEGLVTASDPVTVVELLNLNTGVRVTCRVPTLDGAPRVEGDYVMAGVPGTGARIDLTFKNPASNITGLPLPTGHLREEISLRGESIEVTILDVTNPVVIVRAESLGLTGSELPSALNNNAELLIRIEELRGEAAVRCGLAPDVGSARQLSPAIPRVIIVGRPHDHSLVSDARVKRDDADFVVRTSSMGVIHHAFTGTGLMAAAAAAVLPGTVFDGLSEVHGTNVRLAHPKGIVTLSADVRPGVPQPIIRSVSIARTARRLLHGIAYPSPTAIER